MKRLIAFSVKHPVTILSLLIALLLLGILCAFTISLDFLPVIPPRKLLVAAGYEGIAAAEMRSLVTIPLEDSFASLKGLKSVSSTTRDGLTLLSIELHWGNDSDLALVESREIIDLCYETLPAGCAKPLVMKNDTSDRDAVTVAVIPRDGDLRYARYITDNDIKPRFQRLKGVGSVTSSGGEKEQIQVRLYRDRLEGKQLTVQNVADSIFSANFEYPAGTIREGEKDLRVKTYGLFTRIDDIAETPVMYNNGSLLRVGDIAEVVRSIQRKEAFFLYNGLECVRVGIKKKNEAGPLAVSSAVKNELGLLNDIYGGWYRFEIIEDMSIEIYKSLISLLLSAIAGIVITTVTVRLFLKTWKMSFVVAGIIPISIAVSVTALLAAGKTLNTLSLSGIALGIGMVIDASLVVVENIQKKLQARLARRQTGGDGCLSRAVTEGARELILSNTGSAITTIIVFIPVFFISGLLGQLFADMAIAVIASISVSCVLSMTYIPALCTLLAKDLAKTAPRGTVIARAEKIYTSLLGRIFRRPCFALVPIAVCIIAAVISLSAIQYRLLPDITSRAMNIDIPFPPGSSVGTMHYTALEISNVLLRQSIVSGVQITGGVEHDDYRTLALPGEQTEKLHVALDLTIPEEKARNLIEKLFDGSRYTLMFGKNTGMLSRLLDVANGITILRSDTPQALSERARSVKEQYAVTVVPDSILRESVFTPDRIAAARYDVSAHAMAAVARTALEGAGSSPFYEEGRTIPVLVKLRDEDMRSVADLENTLVRLENTYVPLRILGTFTGEDNEKVLYRYNRMDAKQLYNYPAEKLKNDTSLLNPGMRDLQEMTGNSLTLLIVTLLLLYLVLGAQFESFSIPLLFLLSLPPAFSGALLFLVISGNTLNINAIIALVVLFGISVNNAILLYEACISKKSEYGRTQFPRETIISACTGKLRAVMVTTVTTVAALIPFAIDPQKMNAQSSLSVAVIGGLIFSFVLVLTVLPLCFNFILSRRKG